MAERDWRNLLDDPEVPRIVGMVLKKVGRRTYWRAGDALLYDDLESWIWDNAVNVAISFNADRFTNVTDERALWHSFLYSSLRQNIRSGQHLQSVIGHPGTERALAMRAQRSFDAMLEAVDDHAYGGVLTRHRTGEGDPLVILIRREHLEATLVHAKAQARLSVAPSPYCARAQCLRPSAVKGLCATHYQEHRREWLVGVCSVDGCTAAGEVMGLCQKHRNEQRRQDLQTPRCSIEECDRPARTRGLCSTHYAAAHAAGTHTQYQAPSKPRKTCDIPGCDAPAKARGLCNAHYLAERKRRAGRR